MKTKQVFEPLELNEAVSLKNRLVMAPMTTWSGNADGTVSQAELDYYRVRSQGVSMVITATTYVELSGKGFSGQFYAGDDQMLESLRQLATAIKSAGAVAILQVFHAGRKANPDDMPDGVTRSASAIAGKREAGNVPRAMTETEIQATIKAFGDVVLRAFRAGFDGIEIHGANTYLLQQFVSPHSNRRSDQWGGSLSKRLRLPLAIVDACQRVRDTLPDKNFLLGYRFSPEENSQPGISLDDTAQLVDALCQTDLDYLHISLGDYRQTSMRDTVDCTTILDHVVQTIAGRKLLVAVGSVHAIEDAQNALAAGADLVALGRQLLIDVQTVQRWQRGELAATHYQRDYSKQVDMPKALHDILVSRTGWLPLTVRAD